MSVRVRNPSVVRCLFGRSSDAKKEADFANIDNTINEFSEAEDRKFAMKYGLNLKTGEIVPGSRYEIIPFEKDEEVPSFYTKSYSRKRVTQPRVPSPLHTSNLKLGLISKCDQIISRPAKRKLTYDEDEENEEVIPAKRVPVNGDVVKVPELSSLSSSESSSASNSPIIHYGTKSSIAMDLQDFKLCVAVSQEQDNSTPRKPMNQTSIKDFMLVKKFTKTLHKT